MQSLGREKDFRRDGFAFSSRIFPIEWRIARRLKQKGFLEPLGIGALCFTDTGTGDVFKVYDFTIGTHSKKEVSISGTSESGLRVTLSIYPKPQSYNQIMMLLQDIRLTERPLSQEEKSEDTLASASRFIKHYSAMVASDLRPSSNLSLEDRNRFLAIMQLMLRDHVDSGLEAEKTATLSFNMKDHIELLKECGILKDEDSVMALSNIDRLQLGIIKTEDKGTLKEMRELYSSAYSLSMTSNGKDSQDRKEYEQMLEKIIDEARNMSRLDRKEDTAESCEDNEVVRCGVQPRGLAIFSPVGICRRAPSNEQTSPEAHKATIHVPGLAKFSKRPKMNTFNATVEDLPSFSV